MDFLQRVGAEISLTAQLVYIDHYSFPLRGQEWEVSEVQRLITAGQTGPLCLDQEEEKAESVGDWEGTAELAETVTVPPLCVRIGRCRVIRRDNSAVVKVPRNEAVLIDPEGLWGIYMARIVATLDASCLDPPVAGKSPLVGSGECLRELPEGDLPVAIACHRDDLQAESGSLPVENIYGNQVDTLQIHTAQVKKD
jgi:hypothetical protein